jgi:hypothetical protein
MLRLRGGTSIVGLTKARAISTPSTKSLLSLLAVVLLSAGAGACGGTSSTGSTSSTQSKQGTDSTTGSTTAGAAELGPAPVLSKADADRDNDIGAPYDDTSNREALAVGHPADPADAHTIASLIKRYYRIALAEDGATACAMIYSTMTESIPEDYGSATGGPIYMKGTTCPVVMAKLFVHYHNQLRAEVPKLRILHINVKGHDGIAILEFGTMPERRISVEREGHIWKLATLIDSELP